MYMQGNDCDTCRRQDPYYNLLGHLKLLTFDQEKGLLNKQLWLVVHFESNSFLFSQGSLVSCVLPEASTMRLVHKRASVALMASPVLIWKPAAGHVLLTSGQNMKTSRTVHYARRALDLRTVSICA